MFTPEEKNLIDKLSTIDNIKQELTSLIESTSKNLRQTRKVAKDLDKIMKEKTLWFPWLADAIAQYYEMIDFKIAEFLEKKLKPAFSSADRVREIAKEKRLLQKIFRVTRNLIKYYESLFPWLPEFVGHNLDELVEQITREERKESVEDDPVRFYLTKAEYEKLSTTERNQRALDRYWAKKKKPWEIGRDYERYIGYLYESEGYGVYYQGIMEGLEDLGRDLIAKKDNNIEIIQCKYWSQHKTIHEKHICQLFGTTLKYWIENQREIRKVRNIQQNLFSELIHKKYITGVFITSTSLSSTAHEFAKELGIIVKENFQFNKYPSIKCNISRRTKEKIYHLPFDQQYDKTIIEEERNELYVESVAEAEDLGFRRAFKWKGQKETQQL